MCYINLQSLNPWRHIYNENLKERKTYLFWLLLVVAGLIGFQFLNPIIKPHRYSGSTTEWVVTIMIVIVVTVYFIFHKRFVSIAFDDSNKQIILTTMTMITRDKIGRYSYSDLTIIDGKDSGSFRKKSTEFVEVLYGKQRLIKIEKTSVGKHSFEKILIELQQLKNLPDRIQHTTGRFGQVGGMD